METHWVKQHLKTIEARIDYLKQKHPYHLPLWTYNKLVMEYYKEFYGIELPKYFLELDSVDNVARIFRLRFKDKNMQMEKAVRENINNV